MFLLLTYIDILLLHNDSIHVVKNMLVSFISRCNHISVFMGYILMHKNWIQDYYLLV